MIKVILPHVHASGQREGWWFHITDLAGGKRHKKFAGFADFVGERLTAGECELPPMAVVLLVRPDKSIREDARVADLFAVHPVSGELVGEAYGFAWAEGTSYDKLKASVLTALVKQDNFNEALRRIEEATRGFVGQGNAPELRARLAESIVAVVESAVPLAADIKVTTCEADPNRVKVVFSLPARDCRRLIRCAVPIYNGNGDPDFFYVAVRVPTDYVNVEEDGIEGLSHHHAVARHAADAVGMCEVAELTPVYDSEDGRYGHWDALLNLFNWDTATVVELEGVTE